MRMIVFWGVVTSIIGGIIVLILKGFLFSQGGFAESPLRIEAVKAVESVPVKDSKSYKNTQIESEINDLEELLRIADKIYGSTPRDREYSKIIALALSEGKTAFAFTVADEIYGSNMRNTEYSKIISQCLSLGNYELAIEVAGSVYGSTPRNKEYKRIIAAVIQKRKTSSVDSKFSIEDTLRQLVEKEDDLGQ